MYRRCRNALLQALALGSLAAPAAALDYQFHGYAAQGLLWSSDNNIFGDSTRISGDYRELGLNGSLALGPNLLLSAQGGLRSAGATDTGRARLDFALADYSFLATERVRAGIRAGKIKNPVGFFNDTRDDVFTRPSILLPSAYGDNENQRDLIFGTVGAQLYGNLTLGAHDLSVVMGALRHRYLANSEEPLLITLEYGGTPVPLSVAIDNSWNLQLIDSIDGGRWQFAYSHFYGRFMLDSALPTAPPLAVYGRFDAALDFFSARFNGAAFTLTAEYALNPNKDFVALGGTRIPSDDIQITGDSGYLQGDYRLNQHWSLAARLDASFRNRNDRSGREYAATYPGVSRYQRFAYDYMAGAHYRYNEHWSAWAEYHWIDGSGTVQPLDNVGRTIANRWSVLAVMAGYTF